MNVFLMLVAKNEASRYLSEFLEHHNFFDDYFLYDDQSDDATVELARQAGWNVVIRSDEEPAFMEHEGRFRFASWQHFEKTLNPSTDDWVLSIDADEFLVSKTSQSIWTELRSAIQKAEDLNQHLVVLKRREIWNLDARYCYLRTDGFWKEDPLYRLFKYRPNAQWSDRFMACGSAPTYVGRKGFHCDDVEVLHFGYTEDSDMLERYERYSTLPPHGHNPLHIKSIIQTPRLQPYSGQLPAWVERKLRRD